jgi:hypothetical protein
MSAKNGPGTTLLDFHRRNCEYNTTVQWWLLGKFREDLR